MLVRLSGSTPSLDHSFDGISIGISLDHTLAISLWYVLLVEPSSCNLHEGTLVFLIQGGGVVIARLGYFSKEEEGTEASEPKTRASELTKEELARMQTVT